MRQNRFTFDYVSLVRTHINTQLILRIKYIFANNNSYEMPRLHTISRTIKGTSYNSVLLSCH